MIKEEKLMLNGIELTREQINNYRRKKLIQVRKGKGAGRPTKPIDYVPREQLNAMRDRELNEIASCVNYY